MNIKNIFLIFLFLISTTVYAKAIQTKADYAPIMIFDQMVASEHAFTYTLSEVTSQGTAECTGMATGKKFEHRGKSCLAWKADNIDCKTNLKKVDWLHHIKPGGYAMACDGENLTDVLPDMGSCDVNMSIVPNRFYSRVNLDCRWRCSGSDSCSGKSFYRLSEVK
ncbi:hypothetical protein K1X76_11215 [bacterium]|nr:hypothetical protein [bacterium]